MVHQVEYAINTLYRDIARENDRLTKIVADLTPSVRVLKVMEGTGGKVSVADLIAYQIGWGKALIRWYEAGVRGDEPEMPGDGFTKWDYAAIARHFYASYHYDGSEEQMKIFQQIVARILKIVETEFQTNRLDQTEVWAWCSLSSGKHWPLSKWIRVNTAAPYKRAFQLIQTT